MGVKIRDIASIINGKIEGNPDLEILQPAKIEDAQEGDFTFLYNPKYENYLYTTKASAVLISHDQSVDRSRRASLPTFIRVDNVYQSLAILLDHFGQMDLNDKHSLSELASIDASVQLGDDVNIGAFSVLSKNSIVGQGTFIGSQVYIGEDVVIGQNVLIYPGVKIMKGCKIGNNCILHANCVVGSDGFGFAPNSEGVYMKVPQLGIVRIENDVEIGANTTIDRASLGETVIEQGTKIDNLVHLAHNTVIGKHTVIAAQTGVAGSAKIGDYCQLGGQVGIAGHIAIGNNNRIQAQSGMGKNTPANRAWFGTPAIDYRQYQKSYILFKNLDRMENRIRNLEKQLKDITDNQ